MLIVPMPVQVFASLAPTDMRKSFSGLIGVVETQLGQRVEDGALFLFFNRRRDRLKVLFFTGDGAIILYKRLDRGTFEPLRGVEGAAAGASLSLRADELHLLLEWIELSSVKRRRWREAKESQKLEHSSSENS